MKLYEIIPIQIAEGFVEPNVMLSMKNVLDRGQVTNSFEYLVIARLLAFLKCGEFYKTSNPLFDPVIITPPKYVIDHLRSLSTENIIPIVKKLWNLLLLKDSDAYSHLINPDQEFLIWLHAFSQDDKVIET